MQLIQREVPHNRWNLYLLSDFHVGSALHHRAGLAETIARIRRDKYAHVAIVGDLMESIMVEDKRFQMDTTDPEMPTPLIQIKYLVDILTPIKDKIFVINDGNHELKLRNYGFLIRDLCERLGRPEIYGTFSSVTTFTDDTTGEAQFKLFTSHGMRGVKSAADDPIRRKSNEKLALKRILQDKAGDCLVMARAHTHKIIVAGPEKRLYLKSDGSAITQHYTKSKEVSGNDYIHPDHRWYISTGSFYKLYGANGISGYAERADYDPLPLGYAKLYVRKGEIHKGEEVFV